MTFSAKLKYIGLTILFVVATLNFSKTTMDIIKSSKRLDQLKGEVFEMEKDKAELEESLSLKRTDDYVEQRARNDLNLVKPGEKVFVVVGSKSTKTGDVKGIATVSPDTSTKKKDSRDNNLYKWFRLFF